MRVEMVVLVDDAGEMSGLHAKSSVHHTRTPRHRGFSCHILDHDGRLLMTRRALSKGTWPGVWTNSVCGHPAPGEAFAAAARRRALFELGLDIDGLSCPLPDFSYMARDASGVVENEHCPVLLSRCASSPVPNPDEVAEVEWTTPEQLGRAVSAAPWAFSPWLVEHLPLLMPHLLRTARGSRT